jgi:predicted MFS family arabinose efflux permease
VCLGVASVCITVWYVLIAGLTKPAGAEKTETGGTGKRAAAPLKDRAVLMMLGSMAFYSIHQSGITVWLPMFLITFYKAEAAVANFGLSIYWAGIVAGRLIASRLPRDRVGDFILIRGTLVSGIALAAGLALNSVPALFIGVAVAGFASGSVIPVLISTACGAHPESSGSISSALFVTSSGVRIFVPSAIGAVLAAYGGSAGMLAVAAALPLSAVFSRDALRVLSTRRGGGSDGIAEKLQ